jgi:NAD(P)-dependent dehydrogenase (short-subunit alcohol dehydrogenase family)
LLRAPLEAEAAKVVNLSSRTGSIVIGADLCWDIGYNASKAALNAITVRTARLLADRGVIVVATATERIPPARLTLPDPQPRISRHLGTGAEMPVATRKRERRGWVSCSRRSSRREGMFFSSPTSPLAAPVFAGSIDLS